ncbi:hypothetical protein ACF061_35310 [Streptomyces sp. NPDC015220]|uniref:hypothetical protein n=1 Tax=Streptomyces sp. NPDC015220 TaxID=3364947 RepID=UPI0036F9E04F
MNHMDRTPVDRTDRFELRLTRLMREGEQYTPFEPRHRERLRAGVRARRRARAARRAVGSLLAVAGIGLGLLLLPDRHVRTEPSAPVPRPVSVPSSSPPATTPPPDAPASRTPSSADTTAPPTPGRTRGTPPAGTTMPATSPASYGAAQGPFGTGAARSEPPPAASSLAGTPG